MLYLLDKYDLADFLPFWTDRQTDTGTDRHTGTKRKEWVCYTFWTNMVWRISDFRPVWTEESWIAFSSGRDQTRSLTEMTWKELSKCTF